MIFNLKHLLFVGLLLNSTTNYSQIIVRLWEAETSASANVAVLALINTAETNVKNEMVKLNTELRKQIPYYGLMGIFDAAFERDNIIKGIRLKLSRLDDINNKVPLLFNRKKKRINVNG
ncbi:hypothetical protein [Flavobacterium poyangense]|uniref:hypothetical protein n=1 Tax=Flavobacterium poyangense TaxID=2204302 RepID=UPI0014224576|nr:hypothetical protein [Flavobacterium sp. JXAS1]